MPALVILLAFADIPCGAAAYETLIESWEAVIALVAESALEGLELLRCAVGRATAEVAVDLPEDALGRGFGEFADGDELVVLALLLEIGQALGGYRVQRGFKSFPLARDVQVAGGLERPGQGCVEDALGCTEDAQLLVGQGIDQPESAGGEVAAEVDVAGIVEAGQGFAVRE